MKSADAYAVESVNMLKKHFQDVSRRIQKSVSQVSFRNKQMCMSIGETIQLIQGQLQSQRGGDARAHEDARAYAKEKIELIQEWVGLSQDIRRLAESISVDTRLKADVTTLSERVAYFQHKLDQSKQRLTGEIERVKQRQNQLANSMLRVQFLLHRRVD